MQNFSIVCIVFLSSSILLFGLQPEYFFYAYSIIACCSLGIFLLYKKPEIKLLNYPSNHTFLFLLLWQLFFIGLSASFSVNVQEAVNGFFRHFLIIVVFLFSTYIFKISDIIRQINVSILGCGTGIALINFSLFHPTDHSAPQRIQEIIQYANTLSVLLLLCCIIGIYQISEQLLASNPPRNIHASILYSVCSACCLAGVILTFSRTVWIFSIIAILCVIIRLWDKRLLFKILNILGYSLFLAFFILQFKPGIGVLMILPVIYLTEMLMENFNFAQRLLKIKPVYATFSFFTVLAVILWYIPPTRIIDRLQSIHFRATELLERFMYYQDALNMLRDYLWLGTGEGGWSSLQYSYQSALYATKYVHSHILQYLLDYGLLGLIPLLAMMIFVVSIVWGNLASKNTDIPVIAVLLFVLHAFIDIDFEFPFVGILLTVYIAYLLHATVSKIEKGKFANQMPKKLPPHVTIPPSKSIKTAGVFFILIALLQLPIMIGFISYYTGFAAYMEKKYVFAKVNFQFSVGIYPLLAESYYMLAKSHENLLIQDTQNLKLKEDGIESIQKARNLNPMHPKNFAAQANIAKLTNDLEMAIENYEKLIKGQPLGIEYYEIYASTLLEKAKMEKEKKNLQAAKEDLNKVLAIPSQLNLANSKVSPLANHLKHKVNLSLSPALQKSILEAQLAIATLKDV